MTTALRRTAAFSVPYSKLFLAPANVRSAKQRSPEKVRELAAMIASDGLLSDLQVSAEVDAAGQPTGRFGVLAGGNRLAAIGLLVKEGRLTPDEQVPCQQVAADRATGVSLAENISIQAMHPADEFVAFSALIAQGKSIEAVSAQFGVRPVVVEKRMRLAKVAPALFAQYREDKLSLDQLMALASTDDQKRQLLVWKSLPTYNRSASAIKNRLTENEVEATDWRVKLIGLDRYKASGGAMRTDLFTDEVYLADVGLVDLILAEVLTEAEARVRAEGWAWVEVFETMGYDERSRFQLPPAKYLAESADACAKREAAEAELFRLRDEYEAIADEKGEDDEDADGDETDGDRSEFVSKLRNIDEACDALRAELAAMRAARLDPNGYDKSVLGAIVTTDDGKLKIMRGMMTARQAMSESKTQHAVRNGVSAATATAPPSAEFSEKLVADLTSHRTIAMQAGLVANPVVALAVLADRMYSELGSHRRSGSNADITVRECRSALEREGTRLAESDAARQMDAHAARWAEAIPADAIARLDWLIAQPQTTVLELIAYCTASSFNLVQRRAAVNEHADKIATALRFDMSDWWSVDVDNFLTHVSKAKIVEVVTEARGVEAASPIAGMKKADACIKAAELLHGTRWLPNPLRSGAVMPAHSGADMHARSGNAVNALIGDDGAASDAVGCAVGSSDPVVGVETDGDAEVDTDADSGNEADVREETVAA